MIERLRAGDQLAWSEFVKKYGGRFIAHARRVLGNSGDAEDAAQDAFIKMYKALGTFRDEAALWTWGYRILTNICLDILRSRPPAPVCLDDLDVDPVSNDSVSPFTKVMQDELRQLLEAYLREINVAYRIVIVLRFFEGKSYQEVAGILGIPIGTVKSQMNRGLLELRRVVSPRLRLLTPGSPGQKPGATRRPTGTPGDAQ